MIDSLRAELDLIDEIKTLESNGELIVAYRDLFINSKFNCNNDCYVKVLFENDTAVDVITMPQGRRCELWEFVDKNLNISTIQHIITNN